jgi:hypothetical protein
VEQKFQGEYSTLNRLPVVREAIHRKDHRPAAHNPGQPGLSTVHNGLRIGAVPIRPLLFGSGVFTPEEIAVITAAFEDTLSALGLVDHQDPAVVTVAKRMMEVARSGETDPILLREALLKALRGQSGTSGL